jgi:membrane-associated phospholipid phosphatase
MSTSECLYHPSIGTVRVRIGTPGAWRGWLSFVLQLLAIDALEAGDDIFRGNIHPPNVQAAVHHAHQLVQFEQAQGLFVEPALQLWARHVHGLFGLLSYGTITAATDAIYALGQTLVPLALAIWIWRTHPSHFPLVRTIAMVTVLLGVMGYELYPLAPPRLTTGVVYQGHAFHFQNTAVQVIGSVKLNGVPVGYNAYSAMPSLHIATALIVAGCLLLLSRSLLLRALAALYPFLMLFTVIVSANHYLLDVVGGALTVGLATLLALVLESGHMHLARTRVVQVAAPIPSTALHSTHTKKVSGSQKGTP